MPLTLFWLILFLPYEHLYINLNPLHNCMKCLQLHLAVCLQFRSESIGLLRAWRTSSIKMPLCLSEFLLGAASDYQQHTVRSERLTDVGVSDNSSGMSCS